MSEEHDSLTVGPQQLTPKERECLRLVLENRSSKEIARQLGISHTSVDTHVRRARAKLGLRDRYEAARLVAQWDGQGEAASTPRPTAAERPPSVASVPLFTWIPKLEDVGAAGRLGLVVAVAAFIALVFGIVLNAMRAL